MDQKDLLNQSGEISSGFGKIQNMCTETQGEKASRDYPFKFLGLMKMFCYLFLEVFNTVMELLSIESLSTQYIM